MFLQILCLIWTEDTGHERVNFHFCVCLIAQQVDSRRINVDHAKKRVPRPQYDSGQYGYSHYQTGKGGREGDSIPYASAKNNN